MKVRVLVKSGVLLVCLLLVGISPQMARAQEDTTIVTDTLYSTPEIDGDIWYSEYYSTLFVVTTAVGHGPGDAWDVIVGGENYDRSYLSFNLSPLPDSIIVIEATVNIYQFRSGGNNMLGVFPIWDVPGGDTLFCIMDHINYGAYLDTSDWGAGDPGNPKTLTSNIGIISDDVTIEYKSLNVTRYVQADIDTGRIRSQFRVRFPIDTDQDGRTDELYFYSSRTTPAPYMPVRYKKHNAVEEWGDYNLPVGFELGQNYPNPFNAATAIPYYLSSVRGRPSAVTLRVYNVLGQGVRTLVDEEQAPGYYSVVWDGRGGKGEEVSSGIYFCRMKAPGFEQVRRLVLIK